MKYYKDGFIFEKSKNPNKKYTVYDKNGKRITSFGARTYQHYFDKIGAFSHLNHLDKNRRRLYRLRHGTNPKKLSAGWFALNYLW